MQTWCRRTYGLIQRSVWSLWSDLAMQLIGRNTAESHHTRRREWRRRLLRRTRIALRVLYANSVSIISQRQAVLKKCCKWQYVSGASCKAYPSSHSMSWGREIVPRLARLRVAKSRHTTSSLRLTRLKIKKFCQDTWINPPFFAILFTSLCSDTQQWFLWVSTQSAPTSKFPNLLP